MAGRIKTTGADMAHATSTMRVTNGNNPVAWPLGSITLYDLICLPEKAGAPRGASLDATAPNQIGPQEASIVRPLPAELGRLFQISISVSEPLEPPARGSPPGGACWPQSWSSESELAPLLHGLLSS